ncbi:ABC transporter ATP-binding protein [Haloparvum alkalitolerans]|uniref:ABC transporter ATP-binding protein n=1 Tax=Haloparvum alkalitolerans TaxID=1042953 RepID=UPI003CF1D71B
MTDTALKIRDLTKKFGELTATSHVDLDIERGEFRSVIGPNGAGKTTLFNLISGALQPTSGRIEFDGEPIADLPPHERVRRGVSRSFQITNVFSGLTVHENVRLAVQSKRYADLGRTEALFRDTGSFDEMNDRTDEILRRIGLDDRSEELAGTLAYGDQRRLEIGLVLATDPQLVLLDEPTAGMSSEETRETLALVNEVLADQSIMLIEHDIDLIMDVSDRITVLTRGEVLATGTPTEIAENDAVQDAYLGGGRGE